MHRAPVTAVVADGQFCFNSRLPLPLAIRVTRILVHVQAPHSKSPGLSIILKRNYSSNLHKFNLPLKIVFRWIQLEYHKQIVSGSFICVNVYLKSSGLRLFHHFAGFGKTWQIDFIKKLPFNLPFAGYFFKYR
jgi:hypothetical protein